LQPTADDIAPGFSKDIHEAGIIRDAEVADPGIVRRANEETRDRGTNGPALTGKMMHRAVAPGPGYSAAIGMPGVASGCRPVAAASTSRAIVSCGHGQVPNASMDVDVDDDHLQVGWCGPTQPLVAAAWTTLLPASQRSPAIRFDY
jgi:hypothetical protein